MKTVQDIKDQARAELDSAHKIKDTADQEERLMTGEESATFDKHMAASESLEAAALRQQRIEDAEARQTAVEPKKSELGGGPTVEFASPKQSLYCGGTLRAFKGDNAAEKAYRSGKFIQATLFDDAKARQWCNDHGIEVRVMTEGIAAAGGFLVPEEFETAVISLRESYGVARRECYIQPMASDSIVIPRRVSGVTVYPVGETDAVTASDMAFNQVRLTPHEWAAMTRLSNSLAEDAIISVADNLADEMAYAFASKEDNCLFNGDGTGATYSGIVGIRIKMIDGVHLGSYVEAVAAGDNWTEIDDADLLAVMGALPDYARFNAKWYCSPLAKVAVFDRLLRAGAGNTVINLAGPAPASYNGAPIVECNAMPSDDAAAALNDKIMIIYGDMRKAVSMGARRTMTVAADKSRYLEYRQTAILATERFDINVHDIGGAAVTTRGPLVGLLGTS